MVETVKSGPLELVPGNGETKVLGRDVHLVSRTVYLLPADHRRGFNEDFCFVVPVHRPGGVSRICRDCHYLVAWGEVEVLDDVN